jgi:hypothetical protein
MHFKEFGRVSEQTGANGTQNGGKSNEGIQYASPSVWDAGHRRMGRPNMLNYCFSDVLGVWNAQARRLGRRYAEKSRFSEFHHI